MRDTLKINLELDRIFCHDEGDGWGNAEPYLWTVFFKVDGTSVSISDSLTLDGTGTMQNTPGSHGNLGTTDVDAGDNVTIPSAIGHFETLLSPISVPPSLAALADDVGGLVGVVTVLMEEDNVSDAGAEAGHQALNTAVRDAINQIIATRSLTNQDITDEDINGFTSTIEGTVSNAVQDQQNFFENLWSWINPDDTVGFKVFIFKHDDLAEGGTINFSHRWPSEGDWEIFGHITSSVACPAGAVDSIFGGTSSMRMMSSDGAFSARSIIDPESIEKDITADPKKTKSKKSAKATFDLGTLRKFRDGAYKQYPGLVPWWKLVQRNTPGITYEILKEKGLRKAVSKLMELAPGLVKNLDAKLSDDLLKNAEVLAAGLKETTTNRRLGVDCSRAIDVLPLLKGKTGREAFEVLTSIKPARHPNVGSDPRMRVSKSSYLKALKKKVKKK